MRKSVVLLLVLGLVGSSVAPFLSVKADPIISWPKFAPAPANVNIIFGIASPSENASYSNGTINVCFNETIDGPNSISTYLNIVSTYMGDWMQESQWCPFPPGVNPFHQTSHFLQYNFSVTGIPVGQHSLNITANGGGDFIENETDYSFVLERTISVKFSVSTSPIITLRTNPIITSPSFQNATFTNSSLPLNFTVDHPASEMAYSLDGQDNVSISGNTTLTSRLLISSRCLYKPFRLVSVYSLSSFMSSNPCIILFANSRIISALTSAKPRLFLPAMTSKRSPDLMLSSFLALEGMTIWPLSPTLTVP